MVADPVFLELVYWLIPIVVLGYRVSMASTQELELPWRQLDELTAQMIEVRQQSSSTAMNAAVSGLAEAVRTMGRSVSEPRPGSVGVGKPEPYAPGKDFWRLGFQSTDTRVRSILPCWGHRDNLQQWWWRLHHTNSSLQHCCTSSRCSHWSTESCKKSWEQRFRSLHTSVHDVRNVRSGRQHKIIRASHDLRVWSQCGERGGPPERISGTGEAIRWSERYRTRSQWSEKCVHYFKCASTSEDTSSAECWKPRKLQRITRGGLKIIWGADASSRRLQRNLPKGNEKPSKGKRKEGRKAKKSTQAKVTEKRQQKTHDSMENVETVERVESDNSKHVDDWTPKFKHFHTAAKFISSEHDWMCKWRTLNILLEDSKKRRYSVNWDETNLTGVWKTEEHAFMIDSGCFEHVSRPRFAPQFPMVGSTNVDVVAANNVALQHYGQSGVRARDDKVENESWSRSHLTWWTCSNLSWTLLHWNIVAWQ